MKLPFGQFEDKYIHISEVNSGRTDILCPYCQIPLIAKKGRFKKHHFAHDGVGCITPFSGHLFGLSGRLPIRLPLSIYARKKLAKINLYISSLQQDHLNFKKMEAEEKTILPILKNKLSVVEKKQGTGLVKEVLEQVERYMTHTVAPFPEFHLIRSPYLSMEYTDGKNTAKLADLDGDRYEYYYASIFEPAVKFLKKYHQKTTALKEIGDKINLLEKDLAYFNQFSLYFIEVEVDYQKFYKIGLTSRNLTVRSKEIAQDLKAHFLNVRLTPLFSIKGHAFLETFFKQKYASSQFKIGQLTEYFSFSADQCALILKDFRLLGIHGIPDRKEERWIDWIYFNFNGKIYGTKEKSVYIDKEKIVLSLSEFERLSKVMNLA